MYAYTVGYCTTYGKYSIQQYLDESEFSVGYGRKWINLKAVHTLIANTLINQENSDHFFRSLPQELQVKMIAASYEMIRNIFDMKEYAKRNGVGTQDIGHLHIKPEMVWLNNSIVKIRKNYLLIRPAILE